MNSIPWVEKYRPTSFDEIILDDINKDILTNIIKNNHLPNILFYGPPGTGKTTTIINLINLLHKENSHVNLKSTQHNMIKSKMIHLNASDERGIDVIRNQINQFVQSSSLFCEGTKFVILDEIDYMTKNAQIALKCLLQTFNKNIRFCLICNYISKIDDSLQNIFMRLRFNQLPKTKIHSFLLKINDNEKLSYSKQSLEHIQTLFGSDIRSMINYMQANYKNNQHEISVINQDTWHNLLKQFENHDSNENIFSTFNYIKKTYFLENKNIIINLVNYIIKQKPHYISHKMLDLCEHLIHSNASNLDCYSNYFIIKLSKLLPIDEQNDDSNAVPTAFPKELPK
jgi:replication factor C subunit 3/5